MTNIRAGHFYVDGHEEGDLRLLESDLSTGFMHYLPVVDIGSSGAEDGLHLEVAVRLWNVKLYSMNENRASQ